MYSCNAEVPDCRYLGAGGLLEGGLELEIQLPCGIAGGRDEGAVRIV